MKKLLISLGIILSLVPSYAGAQAVSGGVNNNLWKLLGGSLLPVNSAWGLGSPAMPIINGYFTNITASSSNFFTIGGTVTAGNFVATSTTATTTLRNTNVVCNQGAGFVVDSPTLVVDCVNHLVGIGTTTPQNTLSVSAAGSASIALSGGVANNRIINIQTNAVNRWSIAGTTNPESGGNTGTNLAIGRYSDTGSFINNPLVISRSTGDVQLAATAGNVGIGTTTPWAQLSVNPNGITGPAFAIGSSTKTDFIVDSAGRIAIGTQPAAGTPLVINGISPGGGQPGGGLEVRRTNSTQSIGLSYSDGSTGYLYANGNKPFLIANEGTSDAQSIRIVNNYTAASGQQLGLYVGGGLNFVGVGTSSPTAMLTVNPNSVGTSPYFLIGSSTATNLIVNSQGYMGINPFASSNVVFPLQIEQSISGTVSTLAFLHNYGGAVNSASEIGFGIFGSNNNTRTGAIGNVRTNRAASGDADLYFSTYTNGALSEKMRITDSGNVGIGTVAPTGSLHIRTASTGLPATSGTTQSAALMRLNPNNTNGTLDFGFIASGGGGWIQGTNTTDLTALYPILLNPNGGSVGIGTTSPTNKLEVWDTAFSHHISMLSSTGNDEIAGYYSSETNPRWQAGRDAAGSGVAGFSMRNGALGDNTMASAGVGFGAATGGVGRLGLYTSNGTSLVERVRVDNSGNVGIGTSTPGNVLTAASTANVSVAKFVSANTNVDTIQVQGPISGYASFGMFSAGNASAGGFGYANSGVAGLLSDKVYLYGVGKSIVLDPNGGGNPTFLIKTGTGYAGHATSTPVAVVDAYSTASSTTLLLESAAGTGGCLIIKDSGPATAYTQIYTVGGVLYSKVATNLGTCN